MIVSSLSVAGGTGQLVTGAGWVTAIGVACGGTAGNYVLYDGTSAGGQVLYAATVEPGVASPGLALPHGALPFRSGLYLSVPAGTLAGAITVAAGMTLADLVAFLARIVA